MNKEKLKWAEKSHEEFCKYTYSGFFGFFRRLLTQTSMQGAIIAIRMYEQESISSLKKCYYHYKKINSRSPNSSLCGGR